MEKYGELVVKAVQFGDYPSVKDLIESHQVSAQTCDGDGCSLLHWAAINNRTAIANLLINNGARLTCPGGVLGEAPLHWAVRRSYGRMVDLFIKSGADLSYKSDAGLDALALACRLGLIDMAFLLLSRGANPDTLDNDGETPFLHCLKNDPNMSIIRVLIQFHADVTVQDKEGNTAFHLLLKYGDDIQVIVLNDILMAGGVKKVFAMNENGHTPFKAALNKGNVLMIRYMWDAMVYAMAPSWFQPVLVVLSILAVPVCLQWLGWLWGTLILVFIEVGIFDKLTQPNVFSGNISANFYMSLGVALSLFVNYLMYVHSYVSSFSSSMVIGGTGLLGIVWYLCMTTKPVYRTCNDKEVVLAQLIANSPVDGPVLDEKKTAATSDDSRKWSNMADDVESAKPLIARIDEHEVEPFTLCTHCLVDKCGAHHCNRCQACVVDMNYHCLVTMNCVGAGNSRIHFAFLVIVFLLSSLYFVLALSVEHTVHCPNSHGVLWSFFAVQYCIFYQNPSMFLAPLVLFCTLNYAVSKIHTVVTAIALESTKLDMSRKRNRLTSTQYMSFSEILQKVANFCATGSYPISRRSLREVEAEEKMLAEEEARIAAEKQAQKDKSQGRKYREGSFDEGDASTEKSNLLDAPTTVGRIDR